MQKHSSLLFDFPLFGFVSFGGMFAKAKRIHGDNISRLK